MEINSRRVIVDVTMYAFPIIKAKVSKTILKSDATEKYFCNWTAAIVEKCKHEDLEKFPFRYYEILVAYCDARIKELLESKQQEEPEKVAKLVTFEYTTRVLVNKNQMPEIEEEDAISAAIEKVKSTITTDLCFDHCASVVDDVECPYGTFDGDKTNEENIIDALESLSKNEAFTEMLKWGLIELRVEHYYRENEEEMFAQYICDTIEMAIGFVKAAKDTNQIAHCYVDGGEGCLNILDVE